MLNLKPSSRVDQRTLTFLEQNPSISQTLISELGENISQVATIIEPILDAPSRCEMSMHYIQAVATGRTGFLTTNLPNPQITHVTEVARSWLVGRSSNCAIAILEKTISRCHAVIKYHPGKGFSIMDLGSVNGTFVNRSKLVPLTHKLLKDGDLLEFNKFRIEFFISGMPSALMCSQDTQF